VYGEYYKHGLITRSISFSSGIACITLDNGWVHIRGKRSLRLWEKMTNQQTMSIPVIDCSLTKMPTDGKLHIVPCVQFSFFDNNTIFSMSVEGAVNAIAESVGSTFSTIIS
jgi:hypothetical protein